MLELIVVILLIVILVGRPVAWSSDDPYGFALMIVLLILLGVSILSLAGFGLGFRR